MKEVWKAPLIATLVAVAALIGVVAVSAQTETPPPNDGWGGRGPMHGIGSGAGHGLLAEYADVMHEAVADFLGISLDDLEEAMDQGRSMFALAAERDVDFAELRQVMVETRTEMIEEALADGVITESQAEWMMERTGPAMGGYQYHSGCHGAGPYGFGHMGRGRR